MHHRNNALIVRKFFGNCFIKITGMVRIKEVDHLMKIDIIDTFQRKMDQIRVQNDQILCGITDAPAALVDLELDPENTIVRFRSQERQKIFFVFAAD